MHSVRGSSAEHSSMARPASVLNPLNLVVGSVCSAPAASDSIQLICDGAWMPSSNEAGLGWVLRDPVDLSYIGGGAQVCVLCSSLQAELSACLAGVGWLLIIIFLVILFSRILRSLFVFSLTRKGFRCRWFGRCRCCVP